MPINEGRFCSSIALLQLLQQCCCMKCKSSIIVVWSLWVHPEACGCYCCTGYLKHAIIVIHLDWCITAGKKNLEIENVAQMEGEPFFLFSWPADFHISVHLFSWYSFFLSPAFLLIPSGSRVFFRTVCVLYHVVNLLLYILLQCMFPYSIACHLFVVFVIQNVFLSSEYILTISPSYILMVYCIVTYLTRRVKYRNYGGFAYVLLSLPRTFSPIVLKLL